MSFAPTAVRRIRLLAPQIPTVLLMERFYPLRRGAMLPTGVTIAGPGLHLIKSDPDFVARAHSRGYPVCMDGGRSGRCRPDAQARRRHDHHRLPARGPYPLDAARPV